MARGLAIAVLLLVVLLVAPSAHAASGTYTCANLQTGLNQVQNGDVITVDGMCNDGYTLPSFADPGPAESFKDWTLQGSGGDDGFDGSGLIGERVLTGSDVHRLTIQGLTFRDSSMIGPLANGGAIDITGQSGLLLFNNKFFNNEATEHGGAVHLAQDAPPDGLNSIAFSAFGNVFGSTTDASEGNEALVGGAVSVESPGENHSFTLTDNTFANNVAQWNGGGFAYELAQGGGASVRLDGNDVIANTAGGAGGGGHVSGPIASARVDNDLYQGNSVEPLPGSPQGDHQGGGLFLQSAGPILRHNTFDSNSISAFTTGDLGGGGLAVVTPGVFGSSEFTRIVNNTVAGQPDADWESEGGGLFVSGVGFWTSFLDSIAGNSVGPLGEGGGIYTGFVLTGTTLKLVESTVAGNSVGAGGESAGISGDANDHLVARNSIVWSGGAGDIGGFTDFDLKYSDACKPAGGAFDGDGNICTDPLLVNPAPGFADIHQTAASPTIDAGSDEFLNDFDSERAPTDYEGDDRPTDGDGDGHTVDMGADESPAFVAGPPPPPHTPQCSDGVDNDGDGAIDGADPGCLAGPTDDNEGDETPGDLVLCGQRTISLVRADVKGSKVELSGFVATSLAGQKVKLSVRYLGKGGKAKQLGSVAAGADGSFSGRVAKPSRKLFNLARYRAQVGTAKSVELKLPQSLASSSLRQVAGGMLELRGQVDRAVLGKRNAVVVKRILCGRYTSVGQAKPNKKGKYAVRFPAPTTATGSALYRAETKVLARPGSKRYVKQFARAIGITF